MTEPQPATNDRKLWIGNLDPRITDVVSPFSYWYQLLKLVQTCGSIEKFDLMFHRSGPLTGQPRGYAFVTYVRPEEALKAKASLHGRQLGQRTISVTWANSNEFDYMSADKGKPPVIIPALALTKDLKKTDRVSQIEAIEAKLRLMERKEDELRINESLATKPPMIQQFQFNKDKVASSSKIQKSFKSHDRHKKPYTKRKR